MRRGPYGPGFPISYVAERPPAIHSRISAPASDIHAVVLVVAAARARDHDAVPAIGKQVSPRDRSVRIANPAGRRRFGDTRQAARWSASHITGNELGRYGYAVVKRRFRCTHAGTRLE